MSPELDKATIGAIMQRAHAKKPFVIAARRPSRADVFVFVAADDAAMKHLVDAFAERESFQGLNSLPSATATP